VNPIDLRERAFRYRLLAARSKTELEAAALSQIADELDHRAARLDLVGDLSAIHADSAPASHPERPD
jgi:hypothetical protein